MGRLAHEVPPGSLHTLCRTTLTALPGRRCLRGNEAIFLRHAHIVTAAMLIALLLLWFSPDARGVTAEPEVDKDPSGAPYAAGELLVTYEPEASERDVDEAIEESDARVEEELPAPDAQLLSFPEAQDETTEAARERELREAKEILERDPDVKYVDYNYLRLPAFAPNDPLFADGSLWNLDKIGAPVAWDTVLGGRAKVAVVDSGIVADHPDLTGKIAAQKDMVNNDNVAEDDSVGHGTHVAGTVAAATNNGEGVAAVCPSCKLLIAKSGDQNGLWDLDIVQGIYWSVDNRAKVINLSLGSYGNSRSMEHAVNYAWQHGVVVVAAAGNDATDEPFYPAAYDRVISVAATDQTDGIADSDGQDDFSNYGKIDVAAPGEDILSTVPGGYDAWDGTSMASPHVAALAGLLAAQGRTAPEIRKRIQRTAFDLGDAGKDKYYGWGRINAQRAVIKR
jgi:thermitase